MNETKNFTPSAGSKIEFSLEGTTFTRMYGILSIPQIGDTPNKISTTSLDNETYETEVDGLMPAPQMSFEFNMEDPSAESNIKVAYDMAQDKNVRYWKITKSNGIVHTYTSRVKISYNELPTNEINKFTMYHSPIGEIETTVPTGTPSV